MSCRNLAAGLLLALLAAGAFGQQDPMEEKGFNPTKLYSFGGLDAINTFNGNLIVTLPISQTFRVSPGLSYAFTLVYNSKIWDYHPIAKGFPQRCEYLWGSVFDDCPYQAQETAMLPCRRCNAGLGWVISLGRLVPPEDPTNERTASDRGFLYESPDGREHSFQSMGANPPASYSTFSADDSRLRLDVTPTDKTIYFPDGSKEIFQAIGTNNLEPWRVTELSDAYGNSLRLSYTFGPGRTGETLETWEVNEYQKNSSGVATLKRTHKLYFIVTASGSDPNTSYGTTFQQTRLDRITTKGFGGTDITYQFNHTRTAVPRHPSDTMPSVTNVSATINQYLLTEIVLPDGTKYSMPASDGYELCAGTGTVQCGATGQLKSLTVPTGGKYSWDYGDNTFPVPILVVAPPDHNITPPPPTTPVTNGVVKRTLTDFNRTTAAEQTGTWYYTAQALREQCSNSLDVNVVWERIRQMANAVTAPDGTTEIAYYSIYRGDPDSDPCNAPDPFVPGEFGLPATRFDPDTLSPPNDLQGLLLSTETYVGPPPDATHLPRLERVPGTQGRFRLTGGRLRRLKRVNVEARGFAHEASVLGVSDERTYHFTDDPSYPTTYTETLRDGDDGWGHWAMSVTGGNFGGAKYGTSFTKYNVPPKGTLPPGSQWRFDTYSEQCSRVDPARPTDPVTSCQELLDGKGLPARGPVATKKDFSLRQFCFDTSNGFLKRRRSVRDTSPGDGDIVAEFIPTPAGDVAEEKYYGGDEANGGSVEVAPGDLCTLSGLTQPAYHIFHTYSAGTLESTNFANHFKTVNRGIDPWTGLVAVERDPADLETTYVYDAMGRLTALTPPGVTSTHYSYGAATGSANAYVTTTQQDTADSRGSKFYFDGFGRIIRQLSTTADPAKTRGHDTAFDIMGRKVSETVEGYTNDPYPPATATSSEYDFAGRVTRTRTANASNVLSDSTVAYDTIRGLSRTVKNVAVKPFKTSADATTVEAYDPFGRLIGVTEPLGVTTGDGSTHSTTYEYDVADRLIHVTSAPQERKFNYDNRGFLLQEQHPELGDTGNGTVDYSAYDVFGHARRKITGSVYGPHDLGFAYDDMGRLIGVDHRTSQNTSEPMKEFVYGDTSTPLVPKSIGKIVKSTRHNRIRVNQSLTDVAVEEAFDYGEAAGRLKKKTTTVKIAGTVVRSLDQDYEYSALGDIATLHYPHFAQMNAPDRKVENLYKGGFLVGVDGYSGSHDAPGITYLGSGMIGTVSHTGAANFLSQTDTQEDDQGLPRPKRITFARCTSGPTLIAAEPGDRVVEARTSITLSITPPANAAAPAYQWYRGESGDVSSKVDGATLSSYQTGPLTESSAFWVAVRDGDGCGSFSRAAHITVRGCDLFGITAQPQDRVVVSGTPATFSVTTTDAAGHYEWHQGQAPNGAAIANSDSPQFTTPPLTAAAAYWVRVFSADRACSRDSVTVHANVCHNPVITVQPTSVPAIINAGATATVTTSVAVTGTGPFSYRLDCGASDVHTDSNVFEPYHEFSYVFSAPGSKTCHVTVFDACGTVTSEPVVLQAYPPAVCPEFSVSLDPAITEQDHGGAVVLTATPSVNLGGNSSVRYRWYRDADIALDAALSDTDAGSPTRVVSLDQQTKWLSFYVQVTATCSDGKVRTVTSNRAYISEFGACPTPTLAIKPAVSYLSSSQTVLLQAVTAWPRGHFQWYQGEQNGVRKTVDAVPGHEDQLLVTPALTTVPGKPAAHYWVELSNACGETIRSTPATVSLIQDDGQLCAPIEILPEQPRPADVASGSPTTIALNAASTSPIQSYHWFEGAGRNHDLGTSSTPWKEVAPLVTTSYWVEAMNACAVADSRMITVRVTSCGTNRVVTQPRSNTAITNTEQTSLSVVVANPTGCAYQWYEGSAGDISHPVSSGTAPTFMTPVRSADTQFWVRVTTPEGCAFDSDIALIDVCTPATVTAYSPVAINAGTGTRIAVNAFGSDLTYQWYVGHIPLKTQKLEGKTQNWLYVTPLTTTYYWAEVSNGCTAPAAAAEVAVTVCPTIVSEPTSDVAAVMPGERAHLTIRTEGTELTYEWFIGASGDSSNPVPGGSAASITTPPITAATTFWCRVTSASGCPRTSAPITIPLCSGVAASWTATPRSLHKNESFVLSISASPDTAGVTWYQGTSGDVAGSVALNYSAPTATLMVSPAGTTTYWARVQVANCYADTPTLTLPVCIPTITTQPVASTTVNSGSSTSLVVIVDLSAVTYQWYTGAPGDVTHPVAGATSASINVTPSTTTTYWCRIIGTCGGNTDSAAAVVNVCTPAQITSQPADQSISQGNSASLSLAAIGSGVSYRWYQGVVGDTSTQIAATAAVMVSPADSTTYWARVTGTCGTTDTRAVRVAVCGPPSFTAQASDTKIFTEHTTTLTVAATAPTSEPVTYQWYRGLPSDTSQPVQGATAASMTTPPLSTDTSYWVRAFSGICSTDSNVATVSICELDEVISGPADQTIVSGQTANMSLPNAPGNAEFRWYEGATGDRSHPLSPFWSTTSQVAVSPSATTTYWAEVRVGGCVSRTTATTVSVCAPPSFTTPAYDPVPYGQTVTMTVTASGAAPLHYAWFRGSAGDTSTPVGTDSSTFVTPALTATTRYWIRVSNNCGPQNSTTIVLKVIYATPTGFSASWVSGGGMSLHWNASTGADHYNIERYNGSAYQQIATPSTTSYTDTSATTAGVTYEYRVTASDASTESLSAASAPDIATTMTFTPVVSGSPITATILAEVLTAINRVRAVKSGATALTWPDVLSGYGHTTPPAADGRIYADQFLALRQRMNEALQSIGITPLGYSSVVAPGSNITAAAVGELQVRAQ